MDEQPTDSSPPRPEADGSFAHRAGHDMRAGLAAIGGMLTAVRLTADNLSPEHRQLLDRAQRRTAAVMTLVADVKLYARLRWAGAGPAVQRRAVELGELVRGVAERFRPQAGRAGVELSEAVEPVMIDGDEALLGELASQLLANAIQYTPRGGRIVVTVRLAGERAVVRVADSGIGLSAEARANLFTEFYRAAEARAIQPNGTGLGLAICRRVAEVHGGAVRAESAGGGRGSVFVVELPARSAGRE